MEDIDAADVAYCKVSHGYEKGVSETRNREDLMIRQGGNTINFLLFLSLAPHTQAIPQSTRLQQQPRLCAALAFPLTGCSPSSFVTGTTRWSHAGSCTNRRCLGLAPPPILELNWYRRDVIALCGRGWEPWTCEVWHSDCPLHKPSRAHRIFVKYRPA